MRKKANPSHSHHSLDIRLVAVATSTTALGLYKNGVVKEGKMCVCVCVVAVAVAVTAATDICTQTHTFSLISLVHT